MDYDYSLPKRVKEKSGFKVIIFIILVVLSCVLVVNNLLKPKKTDQKTPFIQGFIGQAKITTKEELISAIRSLISNKPGIYSVYISDFTNNDSFGINENTIFTAASVNKIPILAVLYYLVGKGEIDLDKDITLQPQDIQDGTGSIRYDPTGTVYSYKTLASLMMEKSDNTAAYLLSNQIIGVDKIQEIIDKWGLKQTDMKSNKTSNIDQAKLLKLMYEGKVTSAALTKEMLDFMDDSEFEDRLPRQLPKEIPVYHKIGSEIRNTHDVGIVDPPAGGPYYIGVFITDSPDEEDAKKTISEISRLTYEFFTGLAN